MHSQAPPRRFKQPTLGPSGWSDKSIQRPWSLFLSEVLHSGSQTLDLFSANQKCFLVSSSNDTYKRIEFIRERERGKGQTQ